MPVPKAGKTVNASHPDRVIGNGTPASCTSKKVVRAVAKGGVITFDCGPNPVTIVMKKTAKVVNTSARVVLDGGGKVTLSGAGKRRILYQNTCDQRQKWTTSHCNDQAKPRLVVQNLTFARGNSTGQSYDGGGGGAIFARGGQLKVVNTTFVRNRCDRSGPDLGGAAVRALSQHDGKPVYVVNSTFGGGRCSNALRAEQHRCLVGGPQQRVPQQQRDRPRSQPGPSRHQGWRQRRGDLPRRQPVHAAHRRDPDRGQRRERGRWRGLLREQRPLRLDVGGGLDAAENPSKGFENHPGIFYLGKGKPSFTDSIVQ